MFILWKDDTVHNVEIAVTDICFERDISAAIHVTILMGSQNSRTRYWYIVTSNSRVRSFHRQGIRQLSALNGLRTGRIVPSLESQDEHRGVMSWQRHSSPLPGGKHVNMKTCRSAPTWPACSLPTCLVPRPSLRKRNAQRSFRSQGLVEPIR